MTSLADLDIEGLVHSIQDAVVYDGYPQVNEVLFLYTYEDYYNRDPMEKKIIEELRSRGVPVRSGSWPSVDLSVRTLVHGYSTSLCLTGIGMKFFIPRRAV